jgi:hypothetical protein
MAQLARTSNHAYRREGRGDERTGTWHATSNRSSRPETGRGSSALHRTSIPTFFYSSNWTATAADDRRA